MTATERYVGWFCDPVIAEVTGMAKGGANAVAMGPYCIMSHWNDSNAGTPVGTNGQFISAMQSARQQGLKVVLKPIIDCNSYAGEPNTANWRASINPANMSLWIEDYYAKCFQPFLDLVDMIAIHTELVTISANYPSEMVNLIEQIRMAGFSGPITTSSDFDPANCLYWTALDCIGGDAYPTIRTDSVAHAVADWTPLAQQAQVAATQTGCNTLFGELCPNIGATLSNQQITTMWQGFWEVFGPMPSWAGAVAWRWPQDGSTPAASYMSSFTAGIATSPSYVQPQAVD